MTKGKSLLIVVDYQNDYVDQMGRVAKKLGVNLSESRKLLPVIQDILRVWRQKQNPVLFMLSDYNIKYYSGAFKKFRMNNAYANTAVKGSWGHALYKINPDKRDKIIIKHFPNGFIRTQLEKYLTKTCPSAVYFIGVNTDVCVFHTAFQTALMGYSTFVVEDATAASVRRNKKVFLEYLRRVVGVGIIKSDYLLKKEYERN